MQVNPPSIGLLLIDVSRMLKKCFELNCRGTGMTRAQWQVLSLLNRNPGISQGALAELMEVEPITVGRMVDRLESAGMLERRPHPTDRRAWRLHLLPAAHPVLDALKDLGATTRAQLMAGLTEEEHQTAMRLLGKMKENLANALASSAAKEARVQHGGR
jgi:MarR family transcriptional regulator, transcriptional regulator for hemolysin